MQCLLHATMTLLRCHVNQYGYFLGLKRVNACPIWMSHWPGKELKLNLTEWQCVKHTGHQCKYVTVHYPQNKVNFLFGISRLIPCSSEMKWCNWKQNKQNYHCVNQNIAFNHLLFQAAFWIWWHNMVALFLTYQKSCCCLRIMAAMR